MKNVCNFMMMGREGPLLAIILSLSAVFLACNRSFLPSSTERCHKSSTCYRHVCISTKGNTCNHTQLSLLHMCHHRHHLSIDTQARVGILGASGYTGAELMRILLQHPYATIKHMTADRSAGLAFSDVYPQFSYVKVSHV